MAMTEEQIQQLIGAIVTVQPDTLDCDGCYDQMAEFAESQMLGKTLTESQQAVKTHLENCHCCELAFERLLAALEGIVV